MKSKRRNCRIVRDVSWTKPLQERKTVNTMGKCILIGAGDLTMGELSVTEEDYVIAVDGGLGYCGILNVEPDLIIGDFDSMSEQEKLAVEQLQQTVPEKICRLPECKDDTDMLPAIPISVFMRPPVGDLIIPWRISSVCCISKITVRWGTW